MARRVICTARHGPMEDCIWNEADDCTNHYVVEDPDRRCSFAIEVHDRRETG